MPSVHRAAVLTRPPLASSQPVAVQPHAPAGPQTRSGAAAKDVFVERSSVRALDPARLQKLGEYAKQIGSDSVLVMRDGKVVYEWYAPGVKQDTPVDTWSVAKTFTAATVGVAIQQGHIRSLDQKASDFITEWAGPNDPRRDITLRQLLNGTSGLDTDPYPEKVSRLKYLLNLASDYAWSVPPVGWFKRDQSRYAHAAKLTHAPGTQWKYNNRAIQALETVLERATGMSAEAFARQNLWSPIGMSPATTWKKDASGNPHAYSSVVASTRDLAKFGQLLLQGGKWNGRQIIDAQFAREMRTPSGVNPAYGLLTWLNPKTSTWRGIDNRLFEGQPLPMPADYFSAQGIGNNFVGVSPSSNTVIVHARRAPNERLLSEWPWKNVRELFDDAEQLHHKRFLELLNAAEQRG